MGLKDLDKGAQGHYTPSTDGETEAEGLIRSPTRPILSSLGHAAFPFRPYVITPNELIPHLHAGVPWGWHMGKVGRFLCFCLSPTCPVERRHSSPELSVSNRSPRPQIQARSKGLEGGGAMPLKPPLSLLSKGSLLTRAPGMLVLRAQLFI